MGVIVSGINKKTELIWIHEERDGPDVIPSPSATRFGRRMASGVALRPRRAVPFQRRSNHGTNPAISCRLVPWITIAAQPGADQ